MTAGRKLPGTPLVSAATAWRSAQAKAKQSPGEDGTAGMGGVADRIAPDEHAW